MNWWQKDLIVFMWCTAFWAVLGIAYLIGQGDLL